MTDGASTPAAQAPGALHRLLRNRTAVVSMLLLAFIVLGAIFGPLVYDYRPEKVTADSKVPPTWLPQSPPEYPPLPQWLAGAMKRPQEIALEHWKTQRIQNRWKYPCGTDLNGRDVLSRVIQGARISLLVGLCGALVSFFIGTAYGLIAGYVGGRVDNLMMRLVEVLHSIPRLIIVIVAIFTFAPHLQDWLNAGTAYSLFGRDPRILYTAFVLVFWIVWSLGARTHETTRGRIMWTLALVSAWLLASSFTAVPFREALAAVTVPKVYLTLLLSAALLWLFLSAAKAGGGVAKFTGLAAAVLLSLALSDHAGAKLDELSLKNFVGYNKIVILIICLGLIEWLSMARIVRGQVLALKEQQFVLAARSLGQSHSVILTRHLLPNLVGVVVVYLTLTIPAVILDESFLSFLGLGINDPQASWGSLLSDGKSVINPVKSYWWLLAFPALAMSLTLVALNFLGDALRDALDPRAKR